MDDQTRDEIKIIRDRLNELASCIGSLQVMQAALVVDIRAIQARFWEDSDVRP